MKKGSKVVCKTMPLGPIGIVIRCGRGWCDVKWTAIVTPQRGLETWSKRMKTVSLVSADA